MEQTEIELEIKKERNHSVAIHKDFRRVSLKDWSKMELNILFGIFSLIKNKDIGIIILDVNYLMKIAGFNGSISRRTEFKSSIDRAVKKIGSLMIYDESPKQLKIMPLFKKTILDYEEKTLTVELTDEWAYILNTFGKDFDAFDFFEYTSLKSVYSKALFVRLKGFRKTGECYLNLENFNFTLNPPKSYNSVRIDQRILDPTIDELRKFFPDLSYTKRKDSSKKNKIIGYKFTWTPEAREKFDPNKYKNLNNGDPNNYSNSVLKEYNFSPNHSRRYTKVGQMNYLKLDNFKDTKSSRNRYDLSHWADENGEVVVFETWEGSLLREERRYDDGHVEKVFPKNIKINIPEDILKELKEYTPEEIQIVSNDPEGEALIKELIEEGFFDD